MKGSLMIHDVLEEYLDVNGIDTKVEQLLEEIGMKDRRKIRSETLILIHKMAT